MIDAVSNQFSKFVAFAQERMAAGERKAIATKGDVAVGGGTPLEERTITLTDNGDKVGKLRRDQDLKDANDAVRSLFKKTIIDMFGGESNIPDSVKKEMLLKDYGKGKPLTARRIMYVKNAIDALNRTNCFSDANDPQGARAAKAEERGYKRTDFGKLNTATNLYAAAKGCSLEQAFNEVVTRGSIANRVMDMGALYMKDAASFRRGVEKLEQFAAADARNKELARSNGSADSTRNLSEIANNLSNKYRHLLDDAGKMLAAAKPPSGCKNLLDELRRKFNLIADIFASLAKQLENGTLTDRKAIYDNLFYMSDVYDLTNMLKTVHDRIVAEAPGNKALEAFEAVLTPVIKGAIAGQEELKDEYKAALVDDFLPVATEKLNTAVATAKANGKTAELPQKIFDNLRDHLNGSPFVHMQNLDEFCNDLATNGDAKYRFSADQKKELDGLFKSVLGDGPKTGKALARFISEFEIAFFSEPMLNPNNLKNLTMPRPDFIVAHFKANPEFIKALELGFKLDTEDAAEAVKSRIKEVMDADIEKARKITNPNELTGFASGVMPQAIREYNPGYVTFNGENIPAVPEGSKFKNFMADSLERRGFVAFLETKFDDNHKKMRQVVSYACGMALGFGGAIDGIPSNSEDKNILLGLPRMDATVKGTSVSAHRDHRDTCDIKIAENGDVTISCTRYIHNQINQIMGENGFFGPKHIGKDLPDIACTKVVATMTLKAASDAELGNAMPEFTIDTIQQEPV